MVSNAAPYAAYSASVNPPVGFAVSATTTARWVTATTRPVGHWGSEQNPSAVALEFSVIRSPSFGTTTFNDADFLVAIRPLYQARAAAARAGNSCRAAASRRPSNVAPSV